MAVYPFFKMQNYRENKIRGSISVICFTVRHKYCSFTLTKKRSVPLGKKAFDLQFLKAKRFLQNSDPFLKGTRKWAALKNDSLSQMKDPCTTWSILDWMPKRSWLRDRSHNQNNMNANNLTPKIPLSSDSRTWIWKGLTHLAIVSLPASWIFVSSTKPFRANFTRTEKAIMTPALLWHSWNKQHSWAVELKQYCPIPIFIFPRYLQSHSKINLTHLVLLRYLLWCYTWNNFSIYKYFLHWIWNISEY